MAGFIGGVIGTIFGMLLLTRLTLWMFKKLGDNDRRIFVATAAAYAIAVVVRAGVDTYDGAFVDAALVYAIPTMLWLAVDLRALKGRRAKGQAAPKVTRREDYSVVPVPIPIEELDEDERIVRRAHDNFVAERETREAEYRAKRDAITSDEIKIARATEFIKTSYLSIALPFVQEETQYWPSWSKMDASRWTAPMPISDVDGSTTGGIDNRWVQFRAELGQLHRIEFQKSPVPAEGNMEYGSITLFVDDEEVMGIFVARDWTREWDRWHFTDVESLKIGPWVEGFMAFYNRLRSLAENKSADRSIKSVREKAAKIDLGEAAVERD